MCLSGALNRESPPVVRTARCVILFSKAIPNRRPPKYPPHPPPLESTKARQRSRRGEAGSRQGGAATHRAEMSLSVILEVKWARPWERKPIRLSGSANAYSMPPRTILAALGRSLHRHRHRSRSLGARLAMIHHNNTIKRNVADIFFMKLDSFDF